jgi:hypothetical protein
VQFIYSSNNSNGLLIEYSLLNYTTTAGACPSSEPLYYPVTVNGQTYYTCYYNTMVTTVSPALAATNLGQATLTGSATPGGNDEATLYDGGDNLWHVSYPDSTLNLASAWTQSEFNIVGDCCAFTASFNPGATFIVQTTVDNGTTNQPQYTEAGYTGETSNLTLVPNDSSPVVCPFGGASTGIVFMESNGTVPTPTCSYLRHSYAWLSAVLSLLSGQ